MVCIGNDFNDVACIKMDGLGIAVYDAHNAALDITNIILN